MVGLLSRSSERLLGRVQSNCLMPPCLLSSAYVNKPLGTIGARVRQDITKEGVLYPRWRRVYLKSRSMASLQVKCQKMVVVRLGGAFVYESGAIGGAVKENGCNDQRVRAAVCRKIGFDYRLRLISSESISSTEVMILPFAEKPRWVVIILTNS